MSLPERIVRFPGGRILWDRGGRNVGREVRYIYVEWEGQYDRLLIDITLYDDDFVERKVVPRLPDYLRRVPPVVVPRDPGRDVYHDLLTISRGGFVHADSLRPPLAMLAVDYTKWWRRVYYARLATNPWEGLWGVRPERHSLDLAELRVADDLAVYVPRDVLALWLEARAKCEELLQQLLAIAEQPAAAGSELEVELER